ncbi:MAG: TPM domain-containing protein [Pseudomonadota bacterium]
MIDAGNLLSPAQEAALSQRLGAFEARTRHRVLIATVPSLEGRKLDDAVEEIGNRFGLHDGVVMLVAVRERKVRVAVGRGAMKLITNSEAQRIVSRHMVPDLHANRFDQGILKGADRIMAELSETVG